LNGLNFHTDSKTPSFKTFASAAALTFRYRTQTGNGASTASIDPTNYDNAGTITAIAGTKSTNQRIYLTAGGNVVVQYGQTVYNSQALAQSAINSESFVVFPNLADNAVLLCILTVQTNCTDLTDSTRATFTYASKFGETQAGGGSGGGSGTVSSGTQYRLGYYASTGTTISEAGAITAARALISDANGVPTHSSVTDTELGYVSGVTSAIQTQLNAKTNTQTLTCIGLVLATVADATNYHIGTIAGTPAGTDARRAFKPTSNCTVTAASLVLEQTTNGSNETVSVYLRNVTDATETLIGTFTSDFGASTTLKTLFTGLSISLVTTKDYTIRFTTPTWGTNPANWIPSVTLQMTV